MNYYKSKSGEVFAFNDIQRIPTDLTLLTAAELQAFLAPAPAPSITQVSRAQGKAALIQAGLWDQVLAYVNGIADPTQKALAEVALNDTQEWRRDSAFLNQVATALGLSATQMDDLFTAAAAVTF